MMPHDFAGTGPETARDPLADATAFLGRGIRADGSPDVEDDFGDSERQWVDFIQWAQERGLLLPVDFVGPEREGGREHDVRVDSGSGRWLKFTKPGAAGYTVSWTAQDTPYMHGAAPLDYLQRLLWHNVVFGDDIQLLGLWSAAPHQWRIVTSQPGVQGERTTLAKLESAFTKIGFALLPFRGLGYEGSLAFRFEGYDFWDVHPANVLLAPDGLPLPVDVIITRSPSAVPALTTDH